MHDRPSAGGAAIRLPFPEPPKPGEAITIAPGLLWARMPLPMRLNHVNVWLIEEADGWTAIDCGPDTAEARAAWEALEIGPLGKRSIRRLVATHGHVDHIGCSGWITARHRAPLQATRAAWLWGRVGYLNSGQPTTATALDFLKSHGIAHTHLDGYASDRGITSRMFGPQPTAYERIDNEQSIPIGGRAWRAIVANGHSDEHASFHDAAARVLIAGDQVLQRISPVIGVFSTEPLADPLSEYLASLPRFAPLDPDTLVLPSHGLPFYGLQARVTELGDHHELRLGRALAGLDRPKTAAECALVLFDAKLVESQWLLTMAETLAHLHRLVTLGQVARRPGTDGRVVFERV